MSDIEESESYTSSEEETVLKVTPRASSRGTPSASARAIPKAVRSSNDEEKPKKKSSYVLTPARAETLRKGREKRLLYCKQLQEKKRQEVEDKKKQMKELFNSQFSPPTKKYEIQYV